MVQNLLALQVARYQKQIRCLTPDSNAGNASVVT